VWHLLHAQRPTRNQRIFLADFGIARWVDDASGLTATNMAVGTVAYAAPEQLMGEQVDRRADQYALAATAFHMLTGAPLFQHSNPAVVISQHLNTPPPAIGTRRPALTDLGPVFSKALAKAPDDRYDTCVEFVDALAKQLGTVAAETGATEATVVALAASGPRHRSLPQRPVSRPSKTRAKIVVAVVVALLLAVAAVALVLFAVNVI
jgi:serine/threonine-protein kinase